MLDQSLSSQEPILGDSCVQKPNFPWQWGKTGRVLDSTLAVLPESTRWAAVEACEHTLRMTVPATPSTAVRHEVYMKEEIFIFIWLLYC